MMRQPLWLALLLVLVPALLWYRRHRSGREIASVSLVTELPRSWRVRWRATPLVLRATALGAIAIALTTPSCNRSTSSTGGLDVMFLLDVSISMRGRDVSPDRLSAAVAIASQTLASRPDDRAGLLLFAGDHALVCPLTSDHAALDSRLREVRVSNGEGTAIGPALLAGLDRLGGSRAAALVVMTDGASNLGDLPPLDAATRVAQAGVPLLIVQTGAGGNVPMPTEFGVIEVPMDDDGPVLAEMAARAGGRVIDARREDAAQTLAETLATFDRSRGHVVSERPVRVDRWWGLLALVALLGELTAVVVLRQWI